MHQILIILKFNFLDLNFDGNKILINLIAKKIDFDDFQNMNPLQNYQILQDLLFSPQNFHLIKRIQEKTELKSDIVIREKVRQLSQEKIKRLIDWVQSINLLQPDPKTQRKIIHELAGVQFAFQYHQVFFNINDSPIETDYTGEYRHVNFYGKSSFQTVEVTINIPFLKDALIDDIVNINKESIRKNQVIIKLNSIIEKINNLVDLFNMFIPVEINNLDDLLEYGFFINNKMYEIIERASIEIPHRYSFHLLTWNENKNNLNCIKTERNRTLKLIDMQPLEKFEVINFEENNKLYTLISIVQEQLLANQTDILNDVNVLERIFPQMIAMMSEKMFTDNLSVFSKNDILIIQNRFYNFLHHVIPRLNG